MKNVTKKVLIVATVPGFVTSFLLPHIIQMKSNGYIVDVATSNGEKIPHINKQFMIPIKRSPYKISNIKALFELKKIINTGKYDLVDLHTPIGGILGRLAAINSRKKGTTVIYTAHGFHFYKGAPLISWLLYYPIEKTLSKLTDKIVTIVEEDYNFAVKRNFKAKKIYRINGIGVNKTKFTSRKQTKEISNEFKILVVGELNKNKNQITILKALNEINKDNIKIKIYFAGIGPEIKKLQKYVSKNKLNNKVEFLGFRKDINIILNEIDLVVSASLREGLGINVIEALMMGIPVVASDNRGHRELINNDNGILFSPKNFSKLSSIIYDFYIGKYKDVFTSTSLIESVKKYELTNVLKQQKEIYNIRMFDTEDNY